MEADKLRPAGLWADWGENCRFMSSAHQNTNESFLKLSGEALDGRQAPTVLIPRLQTGLSAEIKEAATAIGCLKFVLLLAAGISFRGLKGAAAKASTGQPPITWACWQPL